MERGTDSLSSSVRNRMEESGADQEQKHPPPKSLPPAPQLDPWLVFFHGKRDQNQTFYSLSEKVEHLKNIPAMRRKYFCTCSHGWLVLIGISSDDCFLLNLITMDKIELPTWKSSFTYKFCVLSSPPNDPNCIVFFIGSSKKDQESAMFCRPGDKEWVMHDINFFEGKNTITKMACCGGKIYGLSFYYRKLVVFDIGSTITIREIIGEEMPRPLWPETYATQAHLVESCGELFLFNLIYLWGRIEIRDIEVFKADFRGKVWVRVVESLGDRAFFLGQYSCTSCSAAKESGIKGDTVYFTVAEDRTLYAFSLEDKSMTKTLPCPNIKCHWSQPEWISPLV